MLLQDPIANLQATSRRRKNRTKYKYNETAPDVTQGPPVASDTILVTVTTYDERGLVETVTSPGGDVVKYLYDDLDRRIAEVENHESGNPVTIEWDTTDERWEVTGGLDFDYLDANRVTSFSYDGNDNVVKQTAHFPKNSSDDEGFQITEYVYGVTTSAPDGSDLASNDLLFQIRYPQESGANEGKPGTTAEYLVTHRYNRMGELKFLRDQNETTHKYTRDDLGRVTVDKGVADDGSDIDDTINAIKTIYDDLGRVDEVISYSDYGGQEDEENGVKFRYNGLWQVITVDQDHNSAVTLTSGNPTGETLRVEYTYASAAMASGNYSRVSTLTYPDGKQLDYGYGPANDSDEDISRVVDLTLGSLETEYSYLGLGRVAVVDYSESDVQLDREVKHNGARTAGTYHALDRFGRVQQHIWIDASLFMTHKTSDAVPNRPPLVELAYTYDRDSNRLTAYDGRPGAKRNNRDWEYEYDELDRLITADRGANGSPFTHVGSNANFTESQGFELDMLGNWDRLITDTNGDGADGAPASGDTKEAREHNGANELEEQDDGTNQLQHTFDDAGNMRTREIASGNPVNPTNAITYTHDPWNRLVAVDNSVYPRLQNEYNGLNWRILKIADTNANGALDTQWMMYYSAGWQLLEERVDEESVLTDDPNSSDIDYHQQYLWGERYIDDIIAHRRDDEANGTYDYQWYHLTDEQYSTVAIIDDSAEIQERIAYDAYGHARHQWLEDVDGDGDHDATDSNMVYVLWRTAGSPGISSGSYNVDADFDRDGDVDGRDYTTSGGSKSALAQGLISSVDVKNSIGWDGYVYSAATDEYVVRHRWYNTGLGRWLERDPIGYGDGQNLYQFVSSQPTLANDPSGLCQSVDGRSSTCPLPGVSPAPTPVVWPGGYTPYPDDRNLPPSEKEVKCCAKHRIAGGNAGVICCEGKRIICVWRPSGLRHPVPRRRANDQDWRKGYDR